MNEQIIPIGKVIQKTSENYGTYNLVLVARVNWRKFKTQAEFTKWMDKFHPRHFFMAYATEKSDEESLSNVMHVYIPLDRANTDWVRENPNCEYLVRSKAAGRRVRSLPIGIPDKQLKKWIEASLPYLDEVISE